MKRNLNRILVAFGVVAVSAATACAEQKVALVNLQKVFDGYYKTKQADSQLKEAAGNFDKIRKERLEEYQKVNEEFKKLVEGSNDPAISTDERDKRRKDAEKKGVEIKQLEDSIRQFDQTSRESLGSQQKRLRENVLNEIRELVNEKAKAGGYSMVIDSAANSAVMAPVFLFTNGENDLSEQLLTQLNQNAPADAFKPKDDKKK